MDENINKPNIASRIKRLKNNNFYKRFIGGRELRKINNKRLGVFTNKNYLIKRINKLLIGTNLKLEFLDNDINYYGHEKINETIIIEGFYSGNKKNTLKIKIYEIEDSWFILEFKFQISRFIDSEFTYICDQEEGVIKLLEDIINILNKVQILKESSVYDIIRNKKYIKLEYKYITDIGNENNFLDVDEVELIPYLPIINKIAKTIYKNPILINVEKNTLVHSLINKKINRVEYEFRITDDNTLAIFVYKLVDDYMVFSYIYRGLLHSGLYIVDTYDGLNDLEKYLEKNAA